jgi:hypothetical protein
MRRYLMTLMLVPLATAAVGNGDPFGFLPDGGRMIFARAFPESRAQQAALAETRSVEEWSASLARTGLTDREVATLAAYLARIAPLQAGLHLLADLPSDGRDMALAQCQSCHSLFSGYLMQRRDRRGWLSIFASPFHAAIPMTEVERAIFADYSAINLPMRLEEVPPELRF